MPTTDMFLRTETPVFRCRTLLKIEYWPSQINIMRSTRIKKARCFVVEVKRCGLLKLEHMGMNFPGRQRMLSSTALPTQPISNACFSLMSLLIACALIAGCSGLQNRQESFEPQTITFDPDKIGKLPPDFSTALTGGGGPISWVVREDSTAPNNKKALVQESSDDTSYRFPMCIYDKFVARDVAVEVNFKAISGKVDQAGGIVLRYTPENYYIARANVLEDNVDLFKTVRGKRSKIEEVTVKVAPGRWHMLRFEAKGRHLTIMFDDKVVIETDDKTFSNPGKVGLWTKADSVSAFTNFKIERVP